MDIKNSIKLIIVDDHALFRAGIRSLLADIPEIEFIGEASNGQELIEKYIVLKPDVVLADISLPDFTGIEAVSRLIKSGQEVKALFISMHVGDDFRYFCLKIGGLGLISKDIFKADLIGAIKTVASGNYCFGKDWGMSRREELIRKYELSPHKNNYHSDCDKLTKRDKQLLKFISDGYTTVQMAEKLNLGKRTIDSYRSSLMKKLNIHSLPELISYAVKCTSVNLI